MKRKEYKVLGEGRHMNAEDVIANSFLKGDYIVTFKCGKDISAGKLKRKIIETIRKDYKKYEDELIYVCIVEKGEVRIVFNAVPEMETIDVAQMIWPLIGPAEVYIYVAGSTREIAEKVLGTKRNTWKWTYISELAVRIMNGRNNRAKTCQSMEL